MPEAKRQEPPLLLVDGHSLVYRAYYATAYSGYVMKAADGTPTNAVQSFASMLLNLLLDYRPEYVMVAFDAGKKTKRHDDYADYKAGRKPMPAELIAQLPLVRELIEALGLFHLGRDGDEADDIIATTARLFSKNGKRVVVVSSDNDLLQLVDENISVVQPVRGTGKTRTVTLENFGECYFPIRPDQVPDFKGIVGDSSDNIQGIKGIGDKGALALLHRYGSLESVLEHAEEQSPAMAKKLADGAASAVLSKRLATVNDALELDFTQESLRPAALDKDRLYAFLEGLQLHFIKRKLQAAIDVARGPYIY